MSKLKNLSPDEQQQLREYIMSVKEIKKQIKELLNKANNGISEEGGNMSSGLTLNVSEE